ncbi:Rv3235 family protein [Microbacterium karelineae]|uniref:Rv3235 family protein n=1 Tax=Microbacterium karelineae TaxID=2654283 RepID=UPI0012E9DB60|nr:Rv3235 family protein [Microbacterium karelineae]
MHAATPRHRTHEIQDMFAPQRTRSEQLPNPTPLVATLAGGALEVIAGVREVDQLARWLAEEPYNTLVVRANLAARARSARSQTARQPVYHLRRILCASPADGVVEATAIVATPARTRAVAMRLEGVDGRWRAASLAIL